MAQRPGVMLYFDVRPCLKRLSCEEKGLLFEGILDYAELGVLPEFDGMLGVAWDFIQPRLDRDGEAYEKSVAQKRYATYCRQCKKNGTEPVAFESWEAALSDDGRSRMVTADNEPYPQTSSKTDSSPYSSTNATATREGSGERRESEEARFSRLRNQKIQQLEQV